MTGRGVVRAIGIALSATVVACSFDPPNSGLPAAELYRLHCLRCHGDDGKGDPRQLAFEPNLDLTRAPRIASGERGIVYQRIATGYGTMPAFGYKLKQGDLEMLVDFVFTFQGPR